MATSPQIPQWIRKVAPPTILLLTERGLDFSGWTNVWVAIALWLMAVVYAWWVWIHPFLVKSREDLVPAWLSFAFVAGMFGLVAPLVAARLNPGATRPYLSIDFAPYAPGEFVRTSFNKAHTGGTHSFRVRISNATDVPAFDLRTDPLRHFRSNSMGDLVESRTPAEDKITGSAWDLGPHSTELIGVTQDFICDPAPCESLNPEFNIKYWIRLYYRRESGKPDEYSTFFSGEAYADRGVIRSREME